MRIENPTWGAPRIHAELCKLGFAVSERTVSRYLQKPTRRAPDEARRQSWRTFLANHREAIGATDFFTVPTVSFRVLSVWFVLNHDRRRILHFDVTEHPTSAWASEQLREAFPFDSAPRYLVFDGDPAFKGAAEATMRSFGIEPKRTAPRSSWQNGVAERWVGTIRRELTNRIIPLNEAHLRRLISEYVGYYNEDRCHLTLGKDPPTPRVVESGPVDAEIVALPRVGGLHHRYTRRKAA